MTVLTVVKKTTERASEKSGEYLRKFSSLPKDVSKTSSLTAFRKKPESNLPHNVHPVVGEKQKNGENIEVIGILTGSAKFDQKNNYQLASFKFDGNPKLSQRIIILGNRKLLPAKEFYEDSKLTQQVRDNDLDGILQRRKVLQEKESEEKRLKNEKNAGKIKVKSNWRKYVRDEDDRQRREKIAADEKKRQEINDRNKNIGKPHDRDDI